MIQKFELSRINVFCGNYGSGKTEISVDVALKLRARGHKVILVDLDIVNPYFRSAEKKQLMEQAGIGVIVPTFANSAVDVPAVPADVLAVFSKYKDYKIVFDVGGDDTGAVALGRFLPYFENDDVSVFFIVNCLRPLSRDEEAICDLLRRVENRARLKVTGLINNTNLGIEATANGVLMGREIVLSAAQRLGLPLVMNVARKDIYDLLPEEIRLNSMPIETRMLPEWM